MFKYAFSSKYTLFDNSEFSFKKIPIKEFLDDVLYPLNEKHLIHKWVDIKNNRHFHKIPNEKIEKVCSAILVRAQDSIVYQIAIDQKARLIGFINNNTFCVVAYDKNHKIYNMS